jgi:Fe-S-cluster-containing hydrogenase component 2
LRPLWFISLMKMNFRFRFILAKASRIPILGSVMDHLLFEGDELIYLPKDSVVEVIVNQSIQAPVSTPLPSIVIHSFIDEASFHWIMDFCICRNSNKCRDYPIDLGCLFMGEAARRIDPRLGHPVTQEEAHHHIRRADAAGLVHLIGRNKLDVAPGEKLLTVCNCCPCCCLWKMLPSLNGVISSKVTKMEGVELTVSPACVGCSACQKVCFINAIKHENGKAVITDECRGCGRCVEACPNNAIKLSAPTPADIENTIRRVGQVVNVK